MNKGNMLIIVAMIAILISSITIVALVITSRSREVTARYAENISTYDIAVATNEMILMYLNEIIDSNRHIIDENNFIAEAMIILPKNNTTYQTNFEFEIESKNGHIIQDIYRADTTINILNDEFIIQTDLFVNPAPAHLVTPRTRVTARIIWENNLDEYSLIMIQSTRIIYPAVTTDEQQTNP